MKGLPRSVSLRRGFYGIDVDSGYAALGEYLLLLLMGQVVCKMGIGKPTDSYLAAMGN